MKIAIPKEIIDGEYRVSATPDSVQKLVGKGFEVLVESGAGERSLFSDDAYESAGAVLSGDVKELYGSCDIVLKVRTPSSNTKLSVHEADLMREKTLLIALLDPYRQTGVLQKLNARNVTALSMEMIPRIARAQRMDALSSQSNIAGYKAVLMAANKIAKMMPLLMTAAGTVIPAKVFVIGAGVAGLQAIATAKRLGAQVEAFDTRPVVKEQVESLGAKFISMQLEEKAVEGAGGYAKELSKDQHEREVELLAKHVTAADIVITTALIPGRPAPRIINEAMVKGMKTGSVIVDLAAEGGGNCDLTSPGEEIEKHGVHILGLTNWASLVAYEASQLFARNITGLLFEAIQDGKINLDLKNEVLKGALITHEGRVVSKPIIKAMKAKTS